MNSTVVSISVNGAKRYSLEDTESVASRGLTIGFVIGSMPEIKSGGFVRKNGKANYNKAILFLREKPLAVTVENWVPGSWRFTVRTLRGVPSGYTSDEEMLEDNCALVDRIADHLDRFVELR